MEAMNFQLQFIDAMRIASSVFSTPIFLTLESVQYAKKDIYLKTIVVISLNQISLLKRKKSQKKTFKFTKQQMFQLKLSEVFKTRQLLSYSLHNSLRFTSLDLLSF